MMFFMCLLIRCIIKNIISDNSNTFSYQKTTNLCQILTIFGHFLEDFGKIPPLLLIDQGEYLCAESWSGKQSILPERVGVVNRSISFCSCRVLSSIIVFCN